MAFEVTIIFAVGAMICWGIGDFLIQRSSRKVGDVEALAFIGIIGAIGILPFVINDIYLLFYPENILLLLLLGIVTFVTAIVDFEALKQGKLSIIDVIIELELPVTIFLGFVLFRETLSIFQMLIISFIFIGIVLIATKSFKHWKSRIEKGVYLAVIAAIGMGFVNFLTASSSKHISPLMAVWFPWIIFTIFCFAIIWKRGTLGNFIQNGRNFKWLVLGMGIFDTIAWLFYAFAVLHNEMSITIAITESYTAVALFLGIWLNKEKIKHHQFFGAFLALACSFILIASL